MFCECLELEDKKLCSLSIDREQLVKKKKEED